MLVARSFCHFALLQSRDFLFPWNLKTLVFSCFDMYLKSEYCLCIWFFFVSRIGIVVPLMLLGLLGWTSNLYLFVFIFAMQTAKSLSPMFWLQSHEKTELPDASQCLHMQIFFWKQRERVECWSCKAGLFKNAGNYKFLLKIQQPMDAKVVECIFWIGKFFVILSTIWTKLTFLFSENFEVL